LASDVSFPTRNPLHIMPSLVHLSSTQPELEYSNVNYPGFDMNYSAPDSTDDEMNVIDDRLPVLPVIEKCSFSFFLNVHLSEMWHRQFQGGTITQHASFAILQWANTFV